MSSPHNLQSTDEDILILIFSYLLVPDLLSVRQTCQKLYRISNQRIIWYNACIHNILRPGYPFPNHVPLDELTGPDLERYTRLAFRLATKWLSFSNRIQQHTDQPSFVGCIPIIHQVNLNASSSTEITTVRFLPGRKEQYLLSVSKGIWSALSLWQISEPSGNRHHDSSMIPQQQEKARWSPKGALFNRFIVNKDVKSEGVIAVSTFVTGQRRTVILTLAEVESENGEGCLGDGMEFKEVSMIDTNLEPMEMQGDIIAFSDDSSETVLFNWRTERSGLLQHEQEEGVFQHDPCVQVVFAYESILVVRARSLHLFPQPELVPPHEVKPTRSIAKHSFGWVDGISAALPAQPFYGHSGYSNSLANTAITILCRTPSHDPWSSGVCTLDLYTLDPNPAFSPLSSNLDSDLLDASDIPTFTSPYIFPPRLTTQAASSRGPLRCLDIVLGKYGTAVWIHPHDGAGHGLISSNTHHQEIPLERTATSDEKLVVAIFAGPLRGCFDSEAKEGDVGRLDGQSVDDEINSEESNSDGDLVDVKTILKNEDNNWTALDYDEAMGRIALGSSFGKLTVLEL